MKLYVVDDQYIAYRPDLPAKRADISDEQKTLILERMTRYGESYQQALKALVSR